MNSKTVHIVTDFPTEGTSRCTLVVGPKTHQDALAALLNKFPDREPMAVVSLADMEATLANAANALKTGVSESFEILRAP